MTTSDDTTAKIWDARSGRELGALREHTDDVFSAAFSPEGRRIVTASSDGRAKTWDTDSGRELAIFKGPTPIMRFAEFSPDGKRLVASCGGAAIPWDTVPWRFEELPGSVGRAAEERMRDYRVAQWRKRMKQEEAARAKAP